MEFNNISNQCYFPDDEQISKDGNNFGFVDDSSPSSSAPNYDVNDMNSSGRRTSRVWKYFRMVNNNHYVCCLCNFVGSYTNTTNMRKHIQNHHPQIYQDILDHTRHHPRQTYLRSYVGAMMPPSYVGPSPMLQHRPDKYLSIPNTSESGFTNITNESYHHPQQQSFKENSFNLSGNYQPSQSLTSSENTAEITIVDHSKSYNKIETNNFGSPMMESPLKIPFINDSINITVIHQKGSEDGKPDMSLLAGGTSSAGMNDNSVESMDHNDGSEDHPLPPSPEQFLTETEDGCNHNSPMLPLRPESYKLRHNNHLNLVLESLADDESFMDVTLTAQGQSLKAHKSVLSAVSPYFKGVLKQNPCQHPIIIMPRDINFEELNSIIGYIYRGEITIAAEELPSLLKTAELLQVTGLSTSEASAVGGLAAGLLGRFQATNSEYLNSSSMKNKTSKKSKTSKAKKDVVTTETEQINPLDFLNQDMAFVKEEIKTETEEIVEPSPPDQEDIVDAEEETTDHGGSKFIDLIQSFAESPKTVSSPPSVENGPSTPYKCPYCAEIKRPLEALESHMSTKHPSKPSFICKICFKVFIRQLLFQTHSKICKNHK